MNTKRTGRVSFIGSPLFVCRFGDDAEDLQFSSRIASEAAPFLSPHCLTVDELLVRFPMKLIPGIVLIIVSPALLRNAAGCRVVSELVTLNCRQMFIPHCCICRGTTVSVVRNHPDLVQLVENLMVCDADQLPGLLESLRHYVLTIMPVSAAHAENSVRSALIFGFSVLCMFLYTAVIRLYFITLVAAIALGGLLWFGGDFKGAVALAMLSAFGAGFRANFLNPTDLFPWLGRRWKYSTQVDLKSGAPSLFPSGLVFGAGLLSAFVFYRQSRPIWAGLMAFGGVIGQVMVDSWSRGSLAKNQDFSKVAADELKGLGADPAHSSYCGLDDLKAAALQRHFSCYWAMVATVCAVAIRVYPTVLFAKRGASSDVWFVSGALAVGWLAPTVFGHFVRRAMAVGSGGVGLTGRFSNTLKPLSRPPVGQIKLPQPKVDRADFERFAPDEQHQVAHWLELMRLPLDRYPIRPWRASRDYAFISYAWRDDVELQTSSRLAQALEAAGVEHFIDKMNIGRGAGWYRMPLSAAICRCTHFFLVVSPNIVAGQVIMKEIELAMGRWLVEMVPSIICIVEPDIAQRLCADKTVPLALRFLLTFCPNMTYAESAQPGVARWIVELTRRHGRGNDLLPFLTPSTTFFQAVRLPGIVDTVNRAAVGP